MTRLAPALPVSERAALTDLVHRYAAGVDDRRLSAVAALFCPDGVLTTPGGRTTAPARHEGRESVEAALSRVSGMAATFHAIVGVVFEAGQAYDATGRVACVAHHIGTRDGGANDEVWHVVYRDRYRRTEDGWRFASRDLQLVFRHSQEVALSS